MADGVFIPKKPPGRWSKKKAGHIPNIEIERETGKVTVRVITAHQLDGYAHYIVKLVLLDNELNFLAESV